MVDIMRDFLQICGRNVHFFELSFSILFINSYFLFAFLFDSS